MGQNHYTELAEYDQFSTDIKKSNDFGDFKEGVFKNFAPTFKLYKN